MIECDILVGITDLNHINNQRAIDQAIEAFRTIMSKTYESRMEDGKPAYPFFENPLLPGRVPEEIED